MPLHCTLCCFKLHCGASNKNKKRHCSRGGRMLACCCSQIAITFPSDSNWQPGNLAERRICVEKSGKFGFCPSCNCFAKTMPDQEASADTATPLKDSTDFDSIMPTAGRKKQTQSTKNPVRCNAPECWTTAKVWMCAMLNKLEREK